MELTFNIWFIIDIGTDLSKYAIVKSYCLDGDDNEKIKLLQSLAETDFKTSERIDFADKSITKFENLEADGYIHKSFINQFFDMNIDYFLTKMEKYLPLTLKFKGGLLEENEAIPQKFPNEPLFVQTFLMENEFGEMKPYTKPENKEWYQSEKVRIDNKSKGMQN